MGAVATFGIQPVHADVDRAATSTLMASVRHNDLQGRNLPLSEVLDSDNGIIGPTPWCKVAAKHGDPEAQFILACAYFNGWGVELDKDAAVRWFHKAAEKGHAEAQKNLGFIYANGDPVAKDYAEAAKWFRLAAEQGNDIAQLVFNSLTHHKEKVTP